MKPPYFDHEKDRHVPETEHRGFNQQSNYFGTGNVTSNTQRSHYIRAWDNVTPLWNGEVPEPGYYTEFDLSFFDLPPRIRRAVIAQTKKDKVCLYRFHTFKNNGIVVHGYVLTRASDNALIMKFYTGPTWKSDDIIDHAAEYISEGMA